MGKTLRDTIHERRRFLQNPYAFVDELEEMACLQQERRKLENPYAHIESLSRVEGHVARFDGISELRPTHWISARLKKKEKYTDTEVERIVRELQRAIWRDRIALFSQAPTDPLDLLDPSVAFEYLGYDFAFAEGLGQFSDGAGRREVAGLVDQQRRMVRVSRQFSPGIRNFTAAHELGHAVLHDTALLHRDRPLSGASVQKDQLEREADKFATYFLMPRKLVCSKFETLFGRTPFSLNEETRFALLGHAAEDPRKWPRNARELSKLLAAVPRFNGRAIVPLAEQFRVSVDAMAIRIEELGLVDQS